MQCSDSAGFVLSTVVVTVVVVVVTTPTVGY